MGQAGADGRMTRLEVVSYLASPNSSGTSGPSPPRLRRFRRETTVFRRLGTPAGCGYSSHPSPELGFSNAEPCSPGGGPDRRGSSAGAVSDLRWRRAWSMPPAIAGYLVRQSGPNTPSKPQDGSGAATSGVSTVAVTWSTSESEPAAGVSSSSSLSRSSLCQARPHPPAFSNWRGLRSWSCVMRVR
jgi:hypothetical protein